VRGGGLLVRAAAMAETAVGESPSTGDLLDVCSCVTSVKRTKIMCSCTICESDLSYTLKEESLLQSYFRKLGNCQFCEELCSCEVLLCVHIDSENGCWKVLIDRCQVILFFYVLISL